MCKENCIICKAKLTHNGVYRAIVKDNRDPKSLGRLKLQVQITGNEVTEWVWPVENVSIDTDLPKIGDGVFVIYQGGDAEYPIWIGSFGKHKTDRKKIYITALPNTTSISSLSSYLKTKKMTDGTTDIDLTATLVAMATTIKNHETRIVALESNLTSLHATLATRTSPSHTHTSAG